jgi:polyphosphate glucokinase
MIVLGIDIGGSGIKGAPVDVEEGRMLTDRFRIPTPENATPDAIADVVAEIVSHFDWKGPFGCTVPARVERGVVHTASNIHQDWVDTHVEELLSERTGSRVAALNDADAAGIASLRFGAGRDCDGIILLLTIGTGIGTALFVDGTLVPNTELGHIILHDGIAEDYASDRTRQAESLSWADWADRFQEYLSRLEFLFALDWIIIGGGVSRPYKTQEYLHLLKTRARLVPETLENEAGIIGAALAAHDRFGK